MYALVLVGDVEGAAAFGDGDALDARQGRELADELAREFAGVGIWGEIAAEVGGDGLPAAGVVPYEHALLVPAVHVAGDEVQLFATLGVEQEEIPDAGYLAVPAHGIHGPEAYDLGAGITGIEETVDAI